jgi:hypothetical protein
MGGITFNLALWTFHMVSAIENKVITEYCTWHIQASDLLIDSVHVGALRTVASLAPFWVPWCLKF